MFWNINYENNLIIDSILSLVTANICIAAGLVTFINLYLGFKSHRVYAATRIVRTTNDPLMAV